MQYEPESWVIVKISPANKEPYYRVLAGWSGSYLYGSSWKMNSGITSFEELEDCYIFYGFSGSSYKCYKTAERLNGMMAMVLGNIIDKNSEVCSVEYVSIEEFLDNFVETV